MLGYEERCIITTLGPSVFWREEESMATQEIYFVSVSLL